MTDMIRAPWTPEQVAALNRFQQAGNMHPFTCGAPHASPPNLVAREDGWHCPGTYRTTCDYRQDWAHTFMADPSAWPESPFGERHGPTPSEATARTPLVCSDERHAVKVAGLEQRIKTLEHVAAGNKRHVQLIVPDLERAEAAVDRVRAACEQLRRASVLADGQPHTDRERGIIRAVDRILAALDAPTAGPAATQTTEADDPDEPYCGIEPPTRADEPGSQWGDCWCTLPPGHNGAHHCQPCTERHGAPGWQDEPDDMDQAEADASASVEFPDTEFKEPAATLKTTPAGLPDTVTDPAWLQQQYAKAARTVPLRLGPNAVAMGQRGEPIILNMNEADDLAAAVIAVRDRHLEQLRGRLELADEARGGIIPAEVGAREDHPGPIDTAHRYCILCGHQVQPGHTCDPTGLRTVYGNLVDRAERKHERTEQLAGVLRDILGEFTAIRDLRDGQRIAYRGPTIAPADYDRWNAALNPQEQP